jgi:hypothetical protein
MKMKRLCKVSDTNKPHYPANRLAVLLTVAILTFATYASAQTSGARRGAIAIGPAVTILLDPGEPVPVQQATQDIASDFEKVFGSRPRIVTRNEDAGPPRS